MQEISKFLSSIFNDTGKLVSYNKRELFARQGIPLPSIGIVISGGFKLIYKNGKKEWIKSFVFSKGILGSIPSLLENKPSSYAIQSIEKSEVLVIESFLLQKSLQENNQYYIYLSKFLADLYLQKEKRIYEFLILTPEERYRNFISDYNENVNKISQIDQAAYLGITNVALSRIKKRIFTSGVKHLEPKS